MTRPQAFRVYHDPGDAFRDAFPARTLPHFADPHVGLVYTDGRRAGAYDVRREPFDLERWREDPGRIPTAFVASEAALERCGPFPEGATAAEIALAIGHKMRIVHVPEVLVDHA